MKSRNFEFLRAHTEELAELATLAEQYAHSDPSAALVKLRLFAEILIKNFLNHYEIPSLSSTNLIEHIAMLKSQSLVPDVVVYKLDALRIEGNKAAHGSADRITPRIALWILRETFDLAKWYSLTVHADETVNDLTFSEPEPEASAPDLKRAHGAVLKQLADREARMQQLLAELEEARKTAAAAEKTAEERKEILAQANQAAGTLHFDEQTTRERLIDRHLARAGWQVGPGYEDTDEVRKEMPVKHQPTESGDGQADYVLFGEDDRPLAVIEAKKTAHDPEKGREQAKWYADGLEREYGRRPVIFYTNGHDIRIWDDAKGEVPRPVYGFYNKDSLQHCVWKTAQQQNIQMTELGPDSDIIDRPYQIEAVKRVCERFQQNRRKALIVQATGTGKTRVAVALTKLLIEARRVKRVLFLCDRRELRKQAYNVFGELLSAEPRVYVTAKTSEDRDQSIYLATYPAMMKYHQNFDVGFFDLVIADESHRSIYNRYLNLFKYFDALQIGLTATPRKVVTHDTYRMFDCEIDDPTAHYSYEEAINNTPPYLSYFEVVSHTTKFLREGIRYADMTDEQKQELEAQVAEVETVDYSKEEVSKAVFNKDTDRKILRNLMENGIREAAGQHIGKTIIFARDHKHAVQLRQAFEEMYPQYMKPKQAFCEVIDNYVERAEQLIDDFKGEGNNDNLTIAISVDMLDTGIDVPEIVNLVFAKPVKSYIKFWQMIGRGTRLCENLFGPGEHKKHFRIFDHWGNFEYFGEDAPEVTPSLKKSLMQTLFEARIAVAEAALAAQDLPAFELATELLEQDVRALPEDTISVREKWRQVKTAQQDGVIRGFDAATVALLRTEIAPLMQWRDLKSRESAYRLDLLVARLQEARLKGSAAFNDLKGDLRIQVGDLPINLGQVVEKIDWINRIKSNDYWQDVTVTALDELRRELRDLMRFRNKPAVAKPPPLEIDVTDIDEQTKKEVVPLDGLDLAAYRHRVESVLKDLFDQSPVLQRIKAGRPVDDAEIRTLVESVLFRDHNIDVDDLLAHFPNKANRLDLAIRRIIGLDAEAVERHFIRFLQKYPELTSHQMRFMAMIKKYIANYGKLEIDTLYEEPFTGMHIESVDGIFNDDNQINDLLDLITEINDMTPAA